MNRRTLFAASAATVASAVTAAGPAQQSQLEQHKLAVLGRAKQWMRHVEPLFAMAYFLGPLDEERDKRPSQPSDPLASQEEQMPSGIILRSEAMGEIDVANLAAMVRQRVRLPLEKLGTLVEALLESDIVAPVAECYEPHHVVICYAGDGSICGVIEICLSCSGFHIFPGGRMISTQYYDMAKVAHVLAEAGLPLNEKNMSAEEYARDITDAIREIGKRHEEWEREQNQKLQEQKR